MRDIAVLVAVFGTLPFILRWPWVGILVFTWLSLMNPHRLAYGIATNFPFALIVALTTLASGAAYVWKAARGETGGASGSG